MYSPRNTTPKQQGRAQDWLSTVSSLCIGCLLVIALLFGFLPSATASSQRQTPEASSKQAAAEAPGLAQFIRDEKGISVIEYSGAYDDDLTAPRQTIAQEFYRTHADVYDFLVVFTSFNFPMSAGAEHPGEKKLAQYMAIRNDVQGIGKAQFDGSSFFGSNGVLQGYIDMSAVSGWSRSTADANYDELLETFAHELQHRWAAYVKFRDWNGNVSSALLGRDGSHWSNLLDTQASVLYGANWRDNGDGSFTAIGTRSILSALDLYLAGLIDKSKVPPLTLIESKDVDPTDLPPPVGTTIRGTKRVVTIEDIIAVEGPRIPSADVSPKSFRFGFIYLVRPGETINPSMLDVVTQARRQVGLRFNALTHGMGTANVFAEPPSISAPGGPSSALPNLPPATNPGQSAAAMTWLKNQQKSDGSFSDAAGLATRDTLLARAHLRAVDPIYSGLGNAATWISNQNLRNTDFLARKLIESTAGERSANDVSALMALRNTDGGWGLGESLRSNPLDTAFALQALKLVNANQSVLKSAAENLLSWQNTDGGWANSPGGPSRVHATAQVIKALAGTATAEVSLSQAKSFLKNRQNADGGFGDGVSSIHDTAHVILALTEAGLASDINQVAAQSFVADNQRIDGSWQGSVYSTVLALQLMRGAAAPNLSISNFQASPQPVYDGQRMTLSAKVTNVGSLQSQASTVRFFDGDPSAGGLSIGDAITIPALVSGDSKNVQVIWNTLSRAGQRTLYAVVDPEQKTIELTRQDNVTSLTVTVEGASSKIDLLLGDGDVLATPATVSKLPTPVKIDALVSNAGLIGVQNAKAVLWSGTGTSRKRIQETTFDIAARATAGIQFNTSVTEAGGAIYTVEIDPDAALSEVTRANNSASVTVKAIGGVSLAVSAADITMSPKTLRPGSDAVFTVKLHNHGTLDSTSFNVRYSIRSGASTTPILTNVVQLAAGASVDQNIPWRVGKGGNYSFVAEIDPEKSSGDIDTTDNAASMSFSVEATAGLNLVVSYKDIAFAPSPALEGRTLVLSAVVRNVGDVDATSFDVEFFDGDPSTGGVLVGGTNVAALSAGKTTTASVNWEVPTATERLIFVVLDRKRSQSTEIALDDNVAFANLKVLTLPDLAVSQGALTLTPRVPKPGEKAQLTVSVANLGEQSADGLVVSAFNGNQASGTKLAPDVVITSLASKASTSVQFPFNAPSVAGLTTITVVVNPLFTIKERIRENNTATITLGTQDGNFSVSESHISPNGDGVKDSTVLTYRLTGEMPVNLQVIDEQGRVLRTSAVSRSESSGSWRWDGLDNDGRLVQDGRYEILVRNTDGIVLGGSTVEVDTNRSSLLAAIGTSSGVTTGLTCTLSSTPVVRSIRDGAGFYLDVPAARDAQVDLPAGIYRQDDWGRGLRMVLSGPMDQGSDQPRPWDMFTANDQGTRMVAYDAGQSQLISAGGEGEGRRVIFNRKITQIIDLIKDGDEVLVRVEDSKIIAIDTRNGAQRVLGISDAYNLRVSPDKKQIIADNSQGGTILLDVISGDVKNLNIQGEYYWSPGGVFLVARAPEKLVLIDSSGSYYGEVNVSRQVGREAWAEDSSELYFSSSDECILSSDKVTSQCTTSIRRVNFVSGDNSVVKDITEFVDYAKFNPKSLAADLAVVPGRYELLINLYVVENCSECKFSARRVPLKGLGFAKLDSNGLQSRSEYRRLDLRAPFSLSNIVFDKLPPPEQFANHSSSGSSRFIEYGRGLFYGSEENPENLTSCVPGKDQKSLEDYVFRTLDNMQIDLLLSRRADGVSVKIYGGVSDKNFGRYWLDYSSDDSPNTWHPISPANTNPVWGKDLANWVTPGAGRYTVRLTVEDLAGNQKTKLRRIAIAQAGPPITNVVRAPEFISPNGDGSNDEMKLSYRVLEPVNLEFGIFNRQGALVRSFSKNHPVAGVDSALVWDGRDNNGQIVIDGEYRINVVGFDFFVNVDNSAPKINLQNYGPPFSLCRGVNCRATELRWAVEDSNFESVQIEVGEGVTPSKWRAYDGVRRVSNNMVGSGGVYLPLADYVGRRYRLVARDLAGNRAVAMFGVPEEMVRMVSVAQILRRDLEPGAQPPKPGVENPMIFDWGTDTTKYMRPAAGLALMFAESLNDPIVSAAVQFNESALAQKNEWLEQAGLQVYPIPEGVNVPYFRDNTPGLKELNDILGEQADRSDVGDLNSVPQHRGFVEIYNSNIPADVGVSLRLKLTGRSGNQYVTNSVQVMDNNIIGIIAEVENGRLYGQVGLKTARVARTLEVFVSSQDDPYFAIERRVLNKEINAIVPDAQFGFEREGRYLSCANYVVRAVVTLDNGGTLLRTATARYCGGVTFRVRPDFGVCDAQAPFSLHGFVTPVSSQNVPLVSMEVYAQSSQGGRELIFNVVNPEYREYEFVWSHGTFPEGKATFIGVATNRDGVKLTGTFDVPVDHTPASLRFTYPQQNQRVCAAREWHKRPSGIADEMVNALRPSVEIDDAAGFDYALEFRRDDGNDETPWEAVYGRRPSIHYGDPRDGAEKKSLKQPYELEEFASSNYMSGRRIAGELGPIVNFTGPVTARVSVFDWSGSKSCRQVSFFLDGSVELGPVSVDRRLFAPGTSSRFSTVSVSVNPLEPLMVSAVVRRVITTGETQTVQEGVVRRLATKMSVLPGITNLIWDGKDDSGSYVEDGDYTFDISYEDGCGNLKVPSADLRMDSLRYSLKVQVDRTPPALQLDRPLAGEVTSSFLDILGSAKDQNLQQWTLEFSLDSVPDSWSMLGSGTTGVDSKKLATLNATSMLDAVTLRLRAVDKVELLSEITRNLRLKPHTELLKEFVVNPTPFSPNGNGRRDSLDIAYDVVQPVLTDLSIKRGSVVVRRLLTQSSSAPGIRRLSWDGKDDGFKGAPDGEYTVEILVTSTTDPTHFQKEELTVLLDNTAPVFELNSPLRAFMSGDASLKASVSDASLTGYQIYIEGPLPGSRRALLAEGSEAMVKQPLGTFDSLGLDDARYRIRVQAGDEAENTMQFVSAEFELDSKAPVVSFTNPVAGTFVSRVSPADIVGQVDDLNLLNVELKIGDVSAFKPQVTGNPLALSFKFDGAATPDGSYAIQLIGTDKAGNIGTARGVIHVDNTPPTALISSPAPHTAIGSMVPIIGTASDDNIEAWKLELGSGVGDGVESLTVIARGTDSIRNAEMTQLVGLPPDGPATLRLSVLDKGGNVSTVDVPLQIDATPPVAPVLAGQREQRNDVRLSWIWQGDSSRIVGYNLYRNDVKINAKPLATLQYLDSGLNDGSYAYAVTAISRSGVESERSNVINIDIKATGPFVQITKPVAGAYVGGVVSIEGSAYAVTNFRSYQVAISALTDPLNWTVLRSSAVQVRGDVLASWSTAGLPENTQYKIRLTADDIQGGSSIAMLTVTIDNIAPAMPSGLQAVLSGTNDVRLNWASNAESDLAGYLLYRDGQLVNQLDPSDNSITSYLLNGTTYLDKSLADGTFVYKLVAVDKAGNQSNPSNPASVRVETRAPKAVIVQPGNGASVDGVVHVRAESKDLDVASVQFEFKPAAASAWSPIGGASTKVPFSVDWNTQGVSNGSYHLRAVAKDTSGNVDPAPEFISVVRKSLQRPLTPSKLVARVDGANVQLSWVASASAGVQGYYLERTDSQGQATRLGTTPIAAVSYVDTDLDDDHYTYKVLAVSAEGNESDPTPETVAVVYTTALKQPYTPLAKAISSVTGSTINTKDAVVLASIPELGVEQTLSVAPDPDGKFTSDAVPLAMGVNMISARQTDSDGNRSRAGTARVARGELPNAPSSVQSVASGSEFQVSWVASSSSDVAGYVVQMDGKNDPKPFSFASATATSAQGSYATADRAIDAYDYTAWQPYATDLKPSLELAISRKELVSELAIVWSPYVAPPKYFAVEAWDGFVWVPLIERLQNTDSNLQFVLDPPYYTNRLRISLDGSEGADSAGAVASVRGKALQIVSGTSVKLPAADGRHTVSVQALSSLGLLGAAASAAPGGIGDVTAPPSVVASVSTSAALATITWTESIASDLAKYEVLRGGAVIAQISAGSPRQYVDGPLANGTYKYTVRPVDLVGNVGELSNEAVATISSALPGNPSLLQLEIPRAGGELRLRWQAPSFGAPIASYAVYRSTVASGPYSLVGTTDRDTLTYLDKTVTNGVRYYYVVRSRGSDGAESEASNEVNGVAVDRSAPLIFYPTDSMSPISTELGSTAVRMFSEPAAKVELSRDGFALATVTSLESTRSSTVFGSGGNWAPSPQSDLVANVRNGSVTVLRVTPMLDGSTAASVIHSGGIPDWSSEPSWSPDASQIALPSSYGPTKILQITNGNTVDSAFTPEIGAMVWHPDGKRWIAIVNGMDLTEIQIDSGASRVLARATDWPSRLTVSPDGQTLAYKDGSKLMALSLVDGSSVSLSEPQLDYEEPLVWSRDGSSLYFLGQKSGAPSQQLYQWFVGQGEPIAVTAKEDGVVHFAVSPVGSVAFLSGGTLYLDEGGGLQSVIANVTDTVRGMKWAHSGTLLVEETSGVQAYVIAGTALFPSIDLKAGQNLLVGRATGSTGRPGQANTISVTRRVTTSAMPDLAVQGTGIALLPLVPQVGIPARITLTVNNLGQAKAPSAAIRVLAISPRGTRQEVLNTRTMDMAAGGSQVFRFDATFDVAGDWQLSVAVDAANEVEEMSEDNNVFVLSVRVVGSGAARTLGVSLANTTYQVGSTLNGSVVLFNGQADIGGHVQISVEDEQGFVVDKLPKLAQAVLAYGQARTVAFSWPIPAIYDASYKVRAVWLNGNEELAQGAAAFLVKPRIQINAKVNSDSSSYALGTAARIVAQIDPTGSSPTTSIARTSLRVLNASGVAVLDAEDSVGLVSGTQLLKTLNTGGLTLGVYTIELKVLIGTQEVALAKSSFEITAAASPIAALTGDIVLDRSSMAHTASITGTAILVNTGGVDFGAFQFEVVVIDPRTNAILARSGQDVSSLNRGAETRVKFSFPAAGMPIGTLWIQLRTSLVTQRAAVKNGLSSNLLRQREIALFELDPPTVVIKQPTDGAYLRAAQSVLVAASDLLSGVRSVEFRVDGGPWLSMMLSDPVSSSYSGVLPVLADGGHQVQARATDNSGNVSSPVQTNFIVDSVAPLISVTGVAEAAYTAAVTPNIEITDTNLSVAQAQLNGNPYVSGTSIAQAGAYVLQIDAIDRAGNTSSRTLRFTISSSSTDATPPVIDIKTPQADVFVRRATNGLKATIVDAESSVAAAEFNIDGGPYAPMALDASQGIPDLYAASLDSLSDGSYGLTVRARDVHGNQAVSPSRRFTVDNTPPVITISGVTAGQYSATVTPIINVTDAALLDSAVTLNGTSYVSGTPISAGGDYLLSVNALDAAGNTAASSVQFSIRPPAPDTDAPVIFIEQPTEGMHVRTGAALIISATDVGSGVAKVEHKLDAQPQWTAAALSSTTGKYVVDVGSLPDGPHSAFVRAIDQAGNASDVQERRFHVDNTAPSVVIGGVASNGQYAGVASASVSVSDSNLLSSTSTLNGLPYLSGSAISSPGVYSLVVAARDIAGNETIVAVQFEVTAGGSPVPLVSITSPAANAVVKSASLVAASVQPFDKVSRLEFAIGNSSSYSSMQPRGSGAYEAVVPGLSDGPVTLRVRAVEVGGTRHPDVVRTFVVDNTPPQVYLGGMSSGGQYPVGQSVTFQVTDAHLDSVVSTLDGLPFTSGQRVFDKGSHELQIVARDRAGNETRRSMVFTIAVNVSQEPVPVPLSFSAAQLLLVCFAMAFLAYGTSKKTQKK